MTLPTRPPDPPRRARAGIAVVVGTRPEAIKLAPLLHALQRHPALDVAVLNSGQHLASVRHVLATFNIVATQELPALHTLPNLLHVVRHLRQSLRSALTHARGLRAVIVQGDTSTAYAGARAAFDAHLPVAHVEAGLRTPDVRDPFPEEWFRREIVHYARWHFAPTRAAAANLLAEGVSADRVHVTGNTGIDSLRSLLEAQHIRPAAARERLIVVTLHRRENWDANAEVFCDALLDIADRYSDVRIVFPVHPNPRIATRIRRRLGAHMAVQLIDPMEYAPFVALMARAALVISDSGGVQEEAPHLGTPLLVPRSNTERPECLDTGFVELVPVHRPAIVAAAGRMLERPRPPALPFDARAPFGAGDAAERIAALLEHELVDPAGT